MIRALAIVCLLAHSTLPQCMACCAASGAGKSSCCRPDERPSPPPNAQSDPAPEPDCCGRAARTCCERAPQTESCCGDAAPASRALQAATPAVEATAERDGSRGQCPGCAVLCVCDGQKAPVSPTSSHVRSVLDAMHAALTLATLDEPSLATGLAGAERDEKLAAFTSESPPERLARLSIWLN